MEKSVAIICLILAYLIYSAFNVEPRPTPDANYCVKTETVYWKDGNHLTPILLCKEKLCR